MKPHQLPLVLLLLLSGCGLFGLHAAPIAPGNDPLIVGTERAQQIALAAFKAAVEFDHDNLAMMKADLPQAHAMVQTLRREFPQAWQDSRSSLALYVALRNEARKQPPATLPTTTPTTQALNLRQAAEQLNAALAVLQREEQLARSALAAGESAKAEAEK